jgi:hypothetical protein
MYVNEILVITKGSFKEHLKKVEEALRRLAHHKLKVHPEKSRFCRFKTESLGFILCHEGIRLRKRRLKPLKPSRHQRTSSKYVPSWA